MWINADLADFNTDFNLTVLIFDSISRNYFQCYNRIVYAFLKNQTLFYCYYNYIYSFYTIYQRNKPNFQVSDGRTMDERWTNDGRTMDERWTMDDGRWTNDGRTMNEGWTKDGRRMGK